MRAEVYPHASRWIMIWAALLFVVLSIGCVSPAIEHLVEVECASHTADLADWENLTPEQRKGSVELSEAAWYEIREALFGE